MILRWVGRVSNERPKVVVMCAHDMLRCHYGVSSLMGRGISNAAVLSCRCEASWCCPWSCAGWRVFPMDVRRRCWCVHEKLQCCYGVSDLVGRVILNVAVLRTVCNGRPKALLMCVHEMLRWCNYYCYGVSNLRDSISKARQGALLVCLLYVALRLWQFELEML